MNTEEREISLFDLFIYVAKGWRSILACMIVIGIANGGLQYAREIKNVKEFEALQLSEDTEEQEEEEKKKEAVQTISQLRREMSEDEIKAVDKVVRLEKEYSQQQNYLESSLIMTMDPEQVNIARLQYWINTDYEVNYMGITKKDYTGNIVDTYLNRLRDNGWKKKALKSSGIQTQLQYFSELVSFGSTDSSFIISIKYTDENRLRKIMAVLEQKVKRCKSEITEIFGAHDLKQINNSMESIMDNDMYNAQQNRKNTLLNLENNISSYKSAFNDNQKSLYAGKIIINEEEEESQEESESTAVDDEEEVLIPPPTPQVRVKNILLGAVLGAFFVCMLRAMCYLLSGKLKPEDDIDACFGIPGLGMIDSNKKKGTKKTGKLDVWLEGLSKRNLGNLSREQQMRMIVTNITLHCQKTGMKQIYLNSSVNCTNEKATNLIDMLLEKGIQIKEGLSILQDATSVEDMGQADGVVFFEQAGTSRYEDLEREIRLCREHEKHIIGMIVLL